MMKVKSVVSRSKYRLVVTFSDGTSGVADLSTHVRRAPFLALADAKVFKEACVEAGTVEWPSVRVGIATEALYALVHKLPKPATLGDVDANELAVRLRGLRQATGKTQVDVAKRAGWTQGALSHFENGSDHKLSTIATYVAALGGELEVSAKIGKKRFPLPVPSK